MSAFTISLKLFSQRFLWINSKYTNQRPFLSSHSHLCNVGQFWLLFPWNSSFVTSLCYWFAAYFFVYSADIYLLSTSLETSTFQVLRLQQWIKQTNPRSDGAYISARISFTTSYFLVFTQLSALPEDLSLLTLWFHIWPEWSFSHLLVLMISIHSL